MEPCGSVLALVDFLAACSEVLARPCDAATVLSEVEVAALARVLAARGVVVIPEPPPPQSAPAGDVHRAWGLAPPERGNLFFKRLLHGVDVSVGGPAGDPMVGLRFGVARQMRNFSYLLGDARLKQCVAVDPCWDVDGIVAYAEREGYRIVSAFCTHYHWDHVGGRGMSELLPSLLLS